MQSSLVTAAIVSLYALAWFLTPAKDHGLDSTYWKVWTKYDFRGSYIVAAWAYGLAMLVVFRNQICSLMIDYLPSRLAQVYPLLAVIGGLGLAVTTANAGGVGGLPFSALFSIAVALKLGVAVRTSWLLLRAKEAPLPRLIAAWLATWLLGSLALGWGYALCLTAAFPTILGANSYLMIALGTALLVPLNRPILSRYLLSQGRHRP
jgi:hypothetical protein